MKWMVTGDKHGDFGLFDIFFEKYEGDPRDLSIIILGDAGFNYSLGERDDWLKEEVSRYGCKFYCVYGNHEERPRNVKDMDVFYDDNVQGFVFRQTKYPNINYFDTLGTYMIDGNSTLVIGGAYSVDKEYRLMCGYRWFKDEQLSQNEMKKAETIYSGRNYDLVLSHTCPYSWEPRDMFIKSIDQSKVDDSMERWMEKFKDTITYRTWLCGHFHTNRQLNDKAVMLYDDIFDLDYLTSGTTCAE